MITIAILSALRREIKPVQAVFPGEIIHEGGMDIVHHVDNARGIEVYSAWGGMGMTNSAAATQALLTVAHPDALFFTGIAGNLNANLTVGDVVLGQRMTYEETDTTIIAEDAPFTQEFASDPQLIAYAQEILDDAGAARVEANSMYSDAASRMYGRGEGYTPQGIRCDNKGEGMSDISKLSLTDCRYCVGSITSSNLFSTDPQVLSEIIEQRHADAEEMEGTAVVHVCAKNRVPAVVVRSVSNDCGEPYDELDSKELELNVSAFMAASVTVLTVGKFIKNVVGVDDMDYVDKLDEYRRCF